MNGNRFHISDSTYKRMIIILSCLFVVFNVVRIINVPVTQDEGWTYVLYVKTSYADIVNCIPRSTNNHFLNTLLTKFCYDTFGHNQFFLRLPNLLGQISFLIYGALLSARLMKNRLLALMCFLVLNLNPFLLEFWGMTRGYGLSLAFMMASMYCLFVYLNRRNFAALFFTVFMAALAVYTQVILLYYLAALSGALFFDHLLSKEKAWKTFFVNELPVLLLHYIALYLLLAGPLKEFQNTDSFLCGGFNGFIPDTIGTLIKESLFLSEGEVFIELMSYLVVVVVLISGPYWIWGYLRGRDVRTGLLLWLMLVIPYACIELQHLVLGTRYITDRAGLFLFVLFTVHTFYLLYHISVGERIWQAVGFILFALAVLNFSRNLNFNRNHYWYLDRDNMLALERVYKQAQAHPGKVKLHPHWLYYPSFAFYIDTRYGDKIESPVFNQAILTPADTLWDYAYVSDDDTANMSPIYFIDTALVDGKAFIIRKK